MHHHLVLNDARLITYPIHTQAEERNNALQRDLSRSKEALEDLQRRFGSSNTAVCR